MTLGVAALNFPEFSRYSVKLLWMCCAVWSYCWAKPLDIFSLCSSASLIFLCLFTSCCFGSVVTWRFPWEQLYFWTLFFETSKRSEDSSEPSLMLLYGKVLPYREWACLVFAILNNIGWLAALMALADTRSSRRWAISISWYLSRSGDSHPAPSSLSPKYTRISPIFFRPDSLIDLLIVRGGIAWINYGILSLVN